MTFAEGFLLVLVTLWLAGWMFTLKDIGFDRYANAWQRAGWVVFLFFSWPIYAWAMANYRH